MNEKEIRLAWLDIISKMYKNLHNSKSVLHSSSVSDKRRDRLMKYFNRIEEIHNKVSKSRRKSDELLLKSFYYDLYVIKPEDIPESYFQNQWKVARERGIIPDTKEKIIEQTINNQKKSLDKWIEYFLYDEESKSYKMWEKYWVFQGLQSLGKYDKETGKFSKRDKTTVYPFPPVEREYIFTTLKLMEDYIKDKTGDDEIKSALGSGNFKLLYEYVIKQSFIKGEHQSNSTEGKWIKYEQGSDYNVLRDSLQGYYTGWCTAAGENFAKSQLAGGDFYVYYSLDEKGEAKVPRIAIRMDDEDIIAEIRGTASNQNMEPEMLPILNEKLKDFPDREKYFKRQKDMSMLTLIEHKMNNNLELNNLELRFLYEIDSQIDGFGYEKDPRIEEIRNKRDLKNDFSIIFNINKDEIALSQEEWKQNPDKFKVLLDNLDLNELTNSKNLKLPIYIRGDLNLNGLNTAEGLILPEWIGGSLCLNGLCTTLGLILPKYIEKSLELSGLINGDGLVLPEYIGWDLILDNMIKVKNLILPEYIGWDLDLSSLISAKNITFSKYIGSNIDLSSLTTAYGLNLPEYIEGTLDLSGLESACDLVLPQNIKIALILNSLKSAEGLVLPYDFNLDKLICSHSIKEEIMRNPNKYYRTSPDNENINHKKR